VNGSWIFNSLTGYLKDIILGVLNKEFKLNVRLLPMNNEGRAAGRDIVLKLDDPAILTMKKAGKPTRETCDTYKVELTRTNGVTVVRNLEGKSKRQRFEFPLKERNQYEVAEQSAQESASNQDIPELIFNEEKNGVELRFKEKPPAEVRKQLTKARFIWNVHKGVWYAKRNASTEELARKLSCQENNSTQPQSQQEEPKPRSGSWGSVPSFFIHFYFLPVRTARYLAHFSAQEQQFMRYFFVGKGNSNNTA
jgi:hypothetical protein